MKLNKHLLDWLKVAAGGEKRPDFMPMQQGLVVETRPAMRDMKKLGSTAEKFHIHCDMCNLPVEFKKPYMLDGRLDVLFQALDINFLVLHPHSILCLDCSMYWEMSYQAALGLLQLEHMAPLVKRGLSDAEGVIFFETEEHYQQFCDRHGGDKEWAIFHEFAVRHNRWERVMERVKRLSTVKTGIMYNREP